MQALAMTERDLTKTSLWEYDVGSVYVLFQKYSHPLWKQSGKEIDSQWIVGRIWCLDPPEEEGAGPLCGSELPQTWTLDFHHRSFFILHYVFLYIKAFFQWLKCEITPLKQLPAKKYKSGTM